MIRSVKMSPQPSIIRVAPSQETSSNETVMQQHGRSNEYDDFVEYIAIGKQEEREQVEDTKTITGKVDVLLLFRFHILIIYSYFHLRLYQNQNLVYLYKILYVI